MKHRAVVNVVKMIAYTTIVNNYDIISTKKKKTPVKHDSQGNIRFTIRRINREML